MLRSSPTPWGRGDKNVKFVGKNIKWRRDSEGRVWRSVFSPYLTYMHIPSTNHSFLPPNKIPDTIIL